VQAPPTEKGSEGPVQERREQQNVRRQNILVFGGLMKSLTDEFYKELIDEQKDNVA
jgi:hypothetical protein